MWLLRLLLAAIPAIIAGALLWYSERDKAFSEWFALHVQPIWQGGMGRFTSLFPFSVNEIVIYLAIAAAVFFLIRDITRLFKNTAKKQWLLRWLRAALLIFGVLFLMSTVGSGVNFSRLTFAEKTGRGMGDLVHPLRVAVSGTGVGPGLFEMLEVMGRDRVLSRIRKTLERFG